MPEETRFPLHFDAEATVDLSGPAERGDVPAVSKAWGSFQLLARVGFGGFGEVYRAWDPHLQREVALKLLLPGAVGGEAEYEAMLREARALASVVHPNIVPVHGIDRADGRVGFWTDFVRGKTLSALVGEQGRFGARETALIGLDVARALSAVHKAGILHRDIKAENVMREEGGRILLMDFGLSSLQHGTAMLAGTPNYMAPELFEGAQATVAADIYAVGVLLYFLISGDFPAKVGGLSARDSLASLQQRRPLMDLRPDMPEALLRTISKAMELDQARRFSSAGQLAEALSESLGNATGAGSSPVTYSGVDRRQSKRGGNRSVWTGIALLGVLAAGAAGWFWIGKKPEARQQARPAGVAATSYDQYQKAQDFLSRSYKNSNVTAAIEGFQAVLKADPDFALAEAGLGAAYFIQYGDSHDAKLLDKSKEAANRAISLAPDTAPAYVTLARIAATHGENSLALQQVRKALSIDANSAEAYGALGDVYSAEGKEDDAVKSYQKAIDLAPLDWRWPVRLGMNLFNAGKIEAAIAQLKQATNLAQDNAVAYYDLGIAHMQLDAMDLARADFETSLKLDADANTYDQLASVLLLEGKYEDAAAMEKKSIALNPNSYVAWGNLGVAYLWSGNKHDEAMAAFRKANELGEAEHSRNRQDPLLLVTLANNYASLGEAAQSEILLRQALALAADDPSIEYQAGEAYESLGRRSEAIGLIAKALGKGYDAFELQHNPELAALRDDPAFLKALEQEKKDQEKRKKK